MCTMRTIATDSLVVTENLHSEADYFERNAERMGYPQSRRQHLFVWSGAIEALCIALQGRNFLFF